MTTLHHVKKARKAIPSAGIKKGDSYYWWKFAYGSKQVSKERPRRSRLTQSVFYASLYDIEDDIADLKPDDGLKDAVDSIIQSIRDLAEEQDEKRSNMPDALQESDTGTMLEERKEACEAAADELEAIDIDIEDKSSDETEEEYFQGKIDEVQSVSIDAP